MNHRALFVLIAGALAAFFLQREQDRGTFATMDRGHVAWLLGNRREAAIDPKANVMLCRLDDIDHSEGERQFESWPPTAEEWGVLLEELGTHHPLTTVIQSGGSLAGGKMDDISKASFKKHAGLILGTRAEGQGQVQEASLEPISKVEGVTSAIPSFQGSVSVTALSELGKPAVSQIDLSDHPNSRISIKDGVCLVPLLYRQDQKVVPSLVLQALIQQLAIPLAEVSVKLGESIVLGTRGAIPIDAAGCFRWHPNAVNESPVASLNLDTFKMTAEQLDRFLPKEDATRSALPKLAKALVWIGEDDQASRRFPLPDGRSMSSAEISSRALLAIQTGNNVQPASTVGQWISLGCALLFGIWQATMNRSRVVKWSVAAVILLGLGTLLTYQSSGQWLPAAPPLIVIGLSTLLNLLIPRAKSV